VNDSGSLIAPYITKRRAVRRVIVHHSAGAPTTTLAEVRRFHVEGRGYSDVGYHAVIRLEGDQWRVEPGRSIVRTGAHDSGQNKGSIGVCVFGDYSTQPPPAEAWALLVRFCAGLLDAYKLPTSALEGHRENEPASTPTLCPGFDPEDLRRAVAEARA
jgi:N-acetylmuramoyl-L-alanine amidase